MESIGEKLKTARKDKNLDLDQIARETNIAKRYLVALEEEDFQVFPGEPYLLGFLRNYAEYLGIKSDELINIYKNVKIQEQPIPVMQLLEKAPTSPVLKAAIGALVLVVVLIVGFFILRQTGQTKSSDASTLTKGQRQEYMLDRSPFEKRFFEGDTLVYSYQNEKYKLTISTIKESVSIETPNGAIAIALGEEVGIDLDKNGLPEVKAFVGDLNKLENQKGALIRFELSQVDAQTSLVATTTPGTTATTVPLTGTETVVNANQGDLSVIDTEKSQILIEAKTSPFPFNVQATFRGYCMFRYEVDRKTRDERLYHKGEQASYSANNQSRIWISNASAVVVQVIAAGKTVPVELGASGEVSVKMIKWVQTEAGTWALTAVSVN